jgi:hypothetical protein
MIAPLLVTVKDDALGGFSRRAIAATDETEAMMPLCAYDLDRAGICRARGGAGQPPRPPGAVDADVVP